MLHTAPRTSAPSPLALDDGPPGDGVPAAPGPEGAIDGATPEAELRRRLRAGEPGERTAAGRELARRQLRFHQAARLRR